MIQKALSVRAPWWWFILHGGKDIENRDWATRYRGTVYLHASKWWQETEVQHEWNSHEALRGMQADPKFPRDQVRSACGHIVGKVDIVDCISGYKRVCDASPWFFGDFGFVLANPVAFAKPVPCKGAQRFFTVPDDVLAQLQEVA